MLEGSNIILLKIPVILWSNLRDNPAFSFVDYVKSGNQLIPGVSFNGKGITGESTSNSVFSTATVASSSSSGPSTINVLKL